jgi:hypothetical protein
MGMRLVEAELEGTEGGKCSTEVAQLPANFQPGNYGSSVKKERSQEARR